MRQIIVSLLILAAACGDPCVVETDEVCADCLPVEQGHPYGPCDPVVGCNGPANVCYSPGAGADVCAKTCTSEADCAAVEYCTPDSAPATCSPWGWCVVTCDAASAACPSGMVCDATLEDVAALGICVWP